MTTIERPYWPRSLRPEPSAPLRAVETAWVATPPQPCLNGCHSGQGDARSPVETEGPSLLCAPCAKRLGQWLRALPDLAALLPHVVEHGTVPGNPETARVRNPDPPAPMRLEILDLLDTRAERGILGILHSWAELIRDERHHSRTCRECYHHRPTHRTDHKNTGCTVVGCYCRRYVPEEHLVLGECELIRSNLPWVTEQDWIGDLYAEIKTLHRQLRDAVGEYRTHPVGTCKARPAGQAETAVCGGPLFMDKESRAVECAECGNRQEADSGLRELGLKVGLIGDNGNRLEAS